MQSRVDDGKDVISGFRSPQSSESCTVMTDRPRTPTKEITGHANGHGKDIVELPRENAKGADAEQSSKL